jgi:DNA-binding MurR/RpiR family transcriptional regulator
MGKIIERHLSQGCRPIRHLAGANPVTPPESQRLTTDPADRESSNRTAQSIQELVRRELAKFTAAESRVAHALLAEYPTAGLETVAKFAERAQTSGPTILRFVARMGFENYANFQSVLRMEIQSRLQGPLSRYKTLPTTGGQSAAAGTVSNALQRNIDYADQDLRQHLPAIVDLLSDPARKILCIGGRFSWMIASYLHHYLRELRPGVRLVRDSSAAWADYLPDVQKGDIVIAFDFRRYQRDVLEFAKGAKAQQGEVILITDVWYSPIAAFSDIVVPCHVSIPSAFDSGVTGLAIVEIITAAVVEALGEKSRDRIATLENLRKPFKLGS